MMDKKQVNNDPVLNFEGKKYMINDLPKETKEIIKALQIAETQFKLYEDTLKLISISRKSLLEKLREELKKY